MTVDRSNKRLAQNAGFVLVAELAVQVVRAATIFVLARLFDDEIVFGTYVSLLALTTLLAPVSQWGMNHVGVRAIARNVPFAETWAKVTSTIGLGGLLGTAVATIVGFTLLDVRPIVAVAFGLAQLVGFNTAQAATMMTEAHHRSDVGLRINIIGGVVRLVMLAAFWAIGQHTLAVWSIFLVAGMVGWGALSSFQVARAFSGAHGFALPTTEDLRHGGGFVFVQTSASGQTDVDKFVLGANDLKADAAIYSPAYRIVEMSTIPLIAVVRATYAEFFRRGASTVSAAMAFAKQLTVLASAYGVVAGIGLFLAAPLIFIILDEEQFADADTVIRWLALIPLLKGLQYFPGNALTGADRHNVRSWIIFVTAAINLVANLIFIPQFGWKAAAVTTLVAETLFAAMLWTAVNVLARRELADGTSTSLPEA